MKKEYYDPHVGEVFTVKGGQTQYRCVEVEDGYTGAAICRKCAFKMDGPCETTACTAERRHDERDVYFTREDG